MCISKYRTYTEDDSTVICFRLARTTFWIFVSVRFMFLINLESFSRTRVSYVSRAANSTFLLFSVTVLPTPFYLLLLMRGDFFTTHLRRFFVRQIIAGGLLLRTFSVCGTNQIPHGNQHVNVTNLITLFGILSDSTGYFLLLMPIYWSNISDSMLKNIRLILTCYQLTKNISHFLLQFTFTKKHITITKSALETVTCYLYSILKNTTPNS